MESNYLKIMTISKKLYSKIRPLNLNSFHHFLLSNFLLIPLVLNSFFSNDKAYLVESDDSTCGIYCKNALFFPEYFENKSFDQYYFQKSLNSFSAGLIMRIFHIKLSEVNANQILEIQSYFLLVIMIPILISIKKVLYFSGLEYWAIYTFIVVNSINLKYLSYSQESPDTTAIFFSLLALSAYLKNKYNLLLIITILSSYIQPQLKLICYIFLIFFSFPKIKINFKINKNEIITKFILITIFFLFILVLFMEIYKDEEAVIYLSSYTIVLLLPLSIIAASIYLSLIINYSIKFSLFNNLIRNFNHKKIRINIITLVLIEVFNFLIRSYFARGEQQSGTSTLVRQLYTLISFFYMSIQQPFKFFIPHVVMFGPVFIIVFILIIKNIGIDKVYSVHIAYVVLSIFFLLSCIDPESRHLVSFLPIIVIVLVVCFNFPKRILIFIVICNILFSRFFATMYTTRLNSDEFLLKMGPWYNNIDYIKAAMLTVLLFIFTNQLLPTTNLFRVNFVWPNGK